jgi:hypothetical protein
MTEFETRQLALLTEIRDATRESRDLNREIRDLLRGDAPPQQQRTSAPTTRQSSAPRGDLPTTFPNYGRSKGGDIFGATMGDLEYYANGARRSIADASKSRWHDKERALLAAIEAEIARQGGGSTRSAPREEQPDMYGRDDRGGYGHDGGAPAEDDIPFLFIETRWDRP